MKKIILKILLWETSMDYQATVKDKKGKLRYLNYSNVSQKEVVALANKATKHRGLELVLIQPIIYA